MNLHSKYMQRCIDLAQNGIGLVAPNPMVGCVLVYNNEIIGEGFHQKYGSAHAEVNAINSISDSSLLKKCTLYVNLEPCAHFGKTPPCADLIIKSKIPYVVIGTIDPYSEVKGKGIEKMLKASIDVKVGILENECKELNKRFFTFHNKKRPYIILKWAQSKDGFIGKDNQANFPISNAESKTLNHLWRTQESAILVGTKTVLVDNPNLTARNVLGNSPIRLVIDKQLTVNQSFNIFNTNAKTIVFNNSKAAEIENIEWIKISESEPELFVKELLKKAYDKNIQSIIVEGGTQTINQFLKTNLWDEARIFVGNTNLETGIKSPTIDFSKAKETKIADNILYVVKNV